MNKTTISTFKKSEDIEKILNEQSKQGLEVSEFKQSKIALRYNVKYKKGKKNLIYTISHKPLEGKGLKKVSDNGNVYLYSSRIKPLINKEDREKTDRSIKRLSYYKLLDMLYILFAIYFIVAIKQSPFSVNRLMYIFPVTLVYSLINFLLRSTNRGKKLPLIVTSILTSVVITAILELIYMIYRAIANFIF